MAEVCGPCEMPRDERVRMVRMVQHVSEHTAPGV